MRWIRRLRSLLRLDVEPDVADFDEFARRTSLRYVRIVFFAFAVSAILWWPTDFLFMELDAALLNARSRTMTTSIAIVGFAATLWLRDRRAGSLAIPIGCAVALSFVMGWNKAQLNDPSGVFLSFAFPLPFIGMVVVQPLHARPFTTGLFGLGYPAGFVAGAPQTLARPDFDLAISFLVFCVVMATVAGHAFFRLIRANFEQRRTLEERIAERTEVLRRLAESIEQSQERERRRVSRELHDETAQLLTAMRLELAMLRRRLDPEQHGPTLSRLEGAIDESFRMHHAIIGSLRPRVLEELGLAPAVRQHLESLAAREELRVEGDVADLPRLDERIELAAFRIVQELTTNALRHGRPETVGVSVRLEGERLAIRVEDDGRGFDTEAATSGFGLLGLRERVRGLGGTCAIDSAPGDGCRAAVRLPVAVSPRSGAERRSEARR